MAGLSGSSSCKYHSEATSKLWKRQRYPLYILPEAQGKTLEQVDYLFVDRALAGLKKDSVADLERVENDMLMDAGSGSVKCIESRNMEATSERRRSRSVD